MALTPLAVPKRNHVSLNFAGPWLPPPDGCSGFSTFASWGSSLGDGYPRLLASGSNHVVNFGAGWSSYYYVDIVNVTDDSFYGAFHAAGTTSGHGTTASILAVGTGAFITDNALNFKLAGFHSPNSMGSPIGMLSVDLDGSTVYDGGDTISITINNDGYIGAHNGVTPTAKWEMFSTGLGMSWLSPVTAGVPAADGYYAFTDETDTKYNAFQNDADYKLSRRWSNTATLGGFNYTIVSAPPKSLAAGLPEIQLYKWQPQAIGGGFVQTNYAIQLSDPTDDLFFQNLIGFTPTKSAGYGPGSADYVVSVRTNNQNTQIAGGVLADPTVTEQTMFCFAPDFSWYDRVDITSDGTLTAGFVFMDLLGNYFLVGTDEHGTAFYSLAGGGGGGGGAGSGGEPLRAYTITVDDHDFYLLNLGQEKTAGLDLSTEQWSMWSSPGLNFFRLSDALAWDFETVGGDFELGLLWTVDATVRDDDDVSGDPSLRVPIQSIVRGFYPQRLRDSLGCFRAVITCAQGDPVSSGVGIKLRTSDDMGRSFKDHGLKILDTPGKTYDIAWPSLGLIRAPGRIFEITDTGYAARIEALDIDLGAQEGAANGQ